LLEQKWGGRSLEGGGRGVGRDGMLVACWVGGGWLLVGCYDRKAAGFER
jgi:hypothetical protein